MTPVEAPFSREAFVASLGFGLDLFQARALDAVDAGHAVVVAAPTGSGKTVVAEYAIAQALAHGAKAFYTTPLKALSNQKYADLVRRHGAERVGLLTGDNAINGDAPVVVMTTEVLRNMIYAGAPALRGLRWVVLDEVHYLQNAYRGPVWEEVIIHTPASVGLVCLSATVSNVEELSDWIGTVRGAAEAVIEEKRPVELHNLYLVGDRSGERLLLVPTLVDGRPNPEALAIDERLKPDQRGRVRSRSRGYTPRRSEVVDFLSRTSDTGLAGIEHDSMLPMIYFIFSRNGCDDAVTQCLREGIRLTTPEERRRIRAIAEAKVEPLSDADLRVLSYGEWLTGLEAGIASHHAGMVPPFKEAVEACFAEALVKVVFATETLSLGINMPARSVVIEKLTKFSGERHEFLTPGEYTQLTGRAGRRGIDDVGYAVVLWSPFVPFDQVASLAGARTYALTSSFRPTYNMAANLVRRYPPATAHHLLNLSFAQYRTDAEVVRLETQLERTRKAADDARAKATCDRGSIEQYRQLVAELRRSRGGHLGANDRADVADALERLKPGDVVAVPRAPGGRLLVLSTAVRRPGDVRVSAVGVDTKRRQLGTGDFPAPPRPITTVELPIPFTPNNRGFQKEAAARLRAAKARGEGGGDPGRRRQRGDGSLSDRDALDSHPVATCPDLGNHLRHASRADRLVAEAERLEQRIRGRSESLARQFDRVLRVLEAWEYVDGWALTPAGERLARIYHEADLLVAECLERGVFDGLDPPSVAALASCFTYEARGPGEAPGAVWFPTRDLRDRWTDVERVTAEINVSEADAGLPETRHPDPGFANLAYGWAKGDELHRLIADEDMSGGDFVRNIKQLVDLLRQLAITAPAAQTRAAADRAADALFRGVVAASSVVGT